MDISNTRRTVQGFNLVDVNDLPFLIKLNSDIASCFEHLRHRPLSDVESFRDVGLTTPALQEV